MKDYTTEEILQLVEEIETETVKTTITPQERDEIINMWW